MLEFLNPSDNDDAIVILKHDHDKVKELFKQFEGSDDLREKKAIAAKAIQELKIHAEIEEKIFYPAVRRELDDEDIMNEADEEHHVAKLLIAELDQMNARDDHWEAKFTVLAENIRHHIREEEGEMLPKARATNIDMETLGRQLLMMKQKLKRDGIPPSDEEKLMKRTRARADSPAKAARNGKAAKAKKPVRVKATKAKNKKAAPRRSSASKARSHRRMANGAHHHGHGAHA